MESDNRVAKDNSSVGYIHYLISHGSSVLKKLPPQLLPNEISNTPYPRTMALL